MNYFVEFNGVKNSDIGIYATRPDIPAAVRKSTSYKIPGRDGALYEYEDAVDDISFSIKFGFFCNPDLWMERFRAAKKWLLSTTFGKLAMSDDPDFFYKVKNISIDTASREVKDIGEFSAKFVCEGYQYARTGNIQMSIEEVRNNPYSVSHPIYQITGEGMCTLSVNGNEMIANVGQNLTINTELMMAYREDGTKQNTEVTGDYEKMYLQEGKNEISVTGGFDLKIIPNWRCL